MKALIVCGSRDGGFTAEMCRSFSDGLAVHGISSDIIFPIEMNIGHCTGCGECSESGCCIISDDMSAVYDSFRESDLLVLATPIHFSGPSSVIKTVIDRFQPLWFKKGKHPGSVVALLSGGGEKPNYLNTISIFKAFSITAGMKWLEPLEIPETDKKERDDIRIPSYEHGKYIGTLLIKDLK